MSFANQCTAFHMISAYVVKELINSDGIKLPDGRVMNDIEENGYKYLRVLEA